MQSSVNRILLSATETPPLPRSSVILDDRLYSLLDFDSAGVEVEYDENDPQKET